MVARAAAPDDDPQATRLYAAEDAVIDDVGPRFRWWREVVAFVDRVTADDLFHEAFPQAPLEIGVMRRSRSARASVAVPDDRVMWIRDGSWNALTVLHELAHLTGPPGPSHGHAFAASELELVRRFCGFDAYVALRTSFAAHDVRW